MNTSLFGLVISDEVKKFYNIDHWCQFLHNFFFSLLMLRANKLEFLSLVKSSIYSASFQTFQPDLLSGMGLGAYPRRELKGALLRQ
jgi:hypothetical protein